MSMMNRLVRDSIDHRSRRDRDIHVACPRPGCDNDDWVNYYEPATAPQCGQHEGPRVTMVRVS